MAEVKEASENKKKKNPHEGHRKRVWQEISRLGFDEEAYDHKVLELILFFTIPRKDTNQLAHELLEHFNDSFTEVMEASVEQLMEVPGIGEYTAVHIKTMLDIARFYQLRKAREKKYIFTTAGASKVMVRMLTDARVETAYLLCLDNANRYIACPKLAEGDEVAVGVSTRKIVETVTKTGATRVLLAHNHPRGVAIPSISDIAITSQLVQALSGMNAVLIDHIIVAENDYVSLRLSKEYEYIFQDKII